MRVTKKLSVFTILVLTICILVGSAFAFAADNEVYKIRFAHGLPATHHVGIEFDNWAKMINEESGGRLKAEVYPGGQLYTDNKLISAVRTGACEMGAIYTFNAATIVPEFNVFVIPMVVNGREQFIKLIEGDIGKKLFGKMEEKGIKPLSWVVWALGGEEMGVICNTPVRVPSDLNGKVTRSMSPEQAQYFQEYCGASSAMVSGAELYMALQRGTLNASVATLSHLVDRKLSEVAPNICLIPIGSYPDILIMNKQFYEKLPEDLQQVIDDVSAKIQEESYTESASVYQEYKLKAEEAVAGRGEIHTPTPEEYALWSKDIEGFWKRVTAKTPGVYEMIMEIQNIK